MSPSGFSASKVVGLRQQTRQQFAPYLRIDFAPDMPGGTWTPLTVPRDYEFTFEDLNPGEERPTDVLDQWSDSSAVALCLWLRNQQQHPAAVARNVVVRVEVEVPRPDTLDPVIQPYTIKLHYLEPQRAVKYVVATASNAIPYAFGRVVEIGYFDLYDRPLSFARGSTEFDWVGNDLVNHRRVPRAGKVGGYRDKQRAAPNYHQRTFRPQYRHHTRPC